MESGVYDSKISSSEELYKVTFDNSLEQSAIYNKVFFECVKKESPAIVLTPQCEILHPKGQLLLTVAEIIPASMVLEQFLEKKGLTPLERIGKNPIPKKQYESFVKEFKNHYLENRVLIYHFLPAYEKKLDHSFIDFRVVKTLLAEQLDDKTKIAVLNSPWREAVPARYAAYSVRIGVKGFLDSFLESVIKDISTLQVTS